MSKLLEKLLALKKEYPALQNMNISILFSIFWVIFAFLDLDPDLVTWLNPDPIRFRIRNIQKICGNLDIQSRFATTLKIEVLHFSLSFLKFKSILS